MVTLSPRGVLIGPGATQLVLMLSFAHSHAKFFVTWFIAPACQLRAPFQITSYSCLVFTTHYNL